MYCLFLNRCQTKHNLVLSLAFDSSYPAALKMVKVALQIKATLECIERLYTCHPDYQWFLKLKCSNCGECADVWHDVTESEKTPLKHGRSDTHYFAKCKLCSRENSFDIVEGSNGEYLSDDSGKFKSIVAFECRGIEPVEFSPRGGWIVDSEDNGTKFNNVDLTEKEWVDYDEKTNTSVGIYDFESKFIKIK